MQKSCVAAIIRAMQTIEELLSEAVQCHEAGELGRAESLYRQILACCPNHPDGLHLLGLIAYQAGQHAQAAALIGRAVQAYPNSTTYLSNYGEVLRAAGRLDDAVAILHRAHQLDPTSANIAFNLGVALIENQEIVQAAQILLQAGQLAPSWPEPRKRLIQSLTKLRELSQAAEHAAQLTLQCPEDAEAFQVLGGILNELKRYDEAEQALHHAIRLQPNNAWALNELGAVYLKRLKTDEAASAWKKAITADPNFDWPYNNYAGILKDIGRADEAVEYFAQGLKLNPTLHAARSNMLLTMHYSTQSTPRQIFEEHRRWEQSFANDPKFAASYANREQVQRSTSDDLDPERTLRIGFVSADFRSHSVADFLESLLKNYPNPKTKFVLIAYSDVSHPDVVTVRLQGYFQTWRNISGLSTEGVTAMIRNDRIDILVDLSGHSAFNRMPVFALKPAPIQITWLGYPNTTGLSTMDFRLTDAWADPPGTSDSLYTEKLWRLPHGFLCFQPTQGSPDVSPLPCLTHPSITLGCFNNFAKLNIPWMRNWSALLKALPEARLLLKATVLGHEYAQRAMQTYFAEAGLDPDRIQLVGAEHDFFRHLAWYQHVDIAIDTYPYHGTTTTCEALWMGVPVFTLAGPTHYSRVGVSLLHAIGHSEWIANSPEEWIEKIMALARNRKRLQDIRTRLRSEMLESPLLDHVRFTADFESALRTMWREYSQKNVSSSHRQLH